MRTRPDWLAHAVLLLGIALFALPVWLAFAGSTQDPDAIARGELSSLPRLSGLGVYGKVLTEGAPGVTRRCGTCCWSPLGMALAIASARSPSRCSRPSRSSSSASRSAWPLLAIFVTLMLPVEVRIIPTYKVVADLGMINTYAGLTLPLIASATATFLFRQFFLDRPRRARRGGAHRRRRPVRFFLDILLPLSATNIAALFVIQFIYGWNQYLWPLLVADRPATRHHRHRHRAR